MFDELQPKKETKKEDKPNNFSLPGFNDYQISKFSGKEVKRIAPPPPVITDFDKRMTDLEVKGKKRGRRNMFIGTIGAAVIALIVMCCVYYLSQDVNDISDRIDKEIEEMPDLSNRKKTLKNPISDNDGLSDDAETKYESDLNNQNANGDEVNEEFNSEGEGVLQEL